MKSPMTRFKWSLRSTRGHKAHGINEGAASGQPALGLTQHAYDLGFGKTALLHWNLLVHLAEKFYVRIPLIKGMITPDPGRLW